MGNGHSLFGEFRKCNICKNEACHWGIQYENTEINKINLHNIFVYDFEEVKKIIEKDNIENIVGKINMTHSLKKPVNLENFTGEINLNQWLCDDCYKKINLNALPKTWGYDVYYNEKYYEKIVLP